MALNNAQLLREFAGDPGILVREYLSGDGTTTTFYLKSPPLLGVVTAITVGGVLQTEVASAPAAGQYTLDDANGRVTWGAAPAAGTDNIAASYYSVEMPDATVTEALRMAGLVAASDADAGPSVALLQAAALACDIMAARTVARPSSISVDGQSISRRGPQDWHALADELRTNTAAGSRGLHSTPIIRIDGYNRNEVSTRDVAAINDRPRQNYYGREDQLP